MVLSLFTDVLCTPWIPFILQAVEKQKNVLPSLVKFWDTTIHTEMLLYMMLLFVLDKILLSVIQQ